MKRVFVFVLGLLPLMLAGCVSVTEEPEVQMLPEVEGAVNAWSLPWRGFRLTLNEGQSVRLLDNQGGLLDRLEGHYEGLAAFRRGESLLVMTLDRTRNQPLLLQVTVEDKPAVEALHHLPVSGMAVEAWCLQPGAPVPMAWLLDDRGRAEQWRLGLAGESPAPVRRIAMPPDAVSCAVFAGKLLVVEEGLAVWAYGADPESALHRTPVDLAMPFGKHLKEPVAVSALPGGLAVLDSGEETAIHLYRQAGGGWDHLERLPWPALEDGEQLYVEPEEGRVRAWSFDEARNNFAETTFAWGHGGEMPPPLPSVRPIAETEPVLYQGDVADDPAIWVNSDRPSDSLVIGTDKKGGGLHVYDLAGDEVQRLEYGRLNNVDLRYGLQTDRGRRDVVAASNRVDNSVALFLIDPASGRLGEAGRIATDLTEIYGLCMYRSRSDGSFHVFANDKDGRYVQYRIQAGEEGLAGTPVRAFRVASQPEGCVADDKRGLLFVGEEKAGVWVLGAEPADATTLTPVIRTGETLTADVEGLALHQTGEESLLVVSSQGSDSYVVLRAEAPWPVLGHFRIGMNAEAGIDGASETDGLEVTSANLGGAFESGLLVVQDGRNVMPDEPQNFKYVPWGEVRRLLGEAR